MLESLIEIIAISVGFKRVELKKKKFEYDVDVSGVEEYRYLGEEVKEALEKLGYKIRISKECGSVVIIDGEVIRDTREECVKAKILPALISQMDGVFELYGRREGKR